MTHLLADSERHIKTGQAGPMLFQVRHVTTYSYKREVGFGEHRMLFRPRDSFDQRLVSSSLAIFPEPAELRWKHDVFGNCVATAHFSRRADELRFESRITVEHGSHLPTVPAGQSGGFGDYAADERHDLAPLICRQHLDPDGVLENWARRFVGANRAGAVMHALMSMTYGIREGFRYCRRAGDGTQEPLTTLAAGQGTCRDFALLMMEAARSLGLAARFITGYIYVPGRERASVLGGGSTHAWCQIYVPHAGWVEFDPTNAIVGGRDLIRIAVTRDPAQAMPLTGSYCGEQSDYGGMSVQVEVTRSEDVLQVAQVA